MLIMLSFIYTGSKRKRVNFLKNTTLFLSIIGFFLFSILSLCSFASEIINVPNEYPRIQDAIDAAKEGDIIIVAQGIYNELINFNGKNITLQSSDPNDTNTVSLTIIDGNTSGSVVTFAGTELSTCTLSGFTIRNGKAEYGGGIYSKLYTCLATIQNNVITSNTAVNYGGGIYYCGGLIQNNAISYCVSIGGGGLTACLGLIQNNKVFGNYSSSGGGAFASCNGIIQNNFVFDNSANKGGAFYTCNGIIQKNTVIGNSATDGGAVWISEGIIQNNILSRNSATTGGAIVQGRKIIRNNIISYNYSAKVGSLAYCGNGTIQNNVVIYNSAGKYCAGLYNCSGIIINNIIWNNIAPEGYQIFDSSTPNYCCIMNYTGGGIGNISDNPMFVNAINGDFHLLDNSPCIDAGSSDTKYNDGCRPPGRKSIHNDMGIYGGPENCNFGINVSMDMLIDYLLGKYNFSPEELVIANFNVDPVVDIADLTFLINFLNGK